jgi:hypothetical protein
LVGGLAAVAHFCLKLLNRSDREWTAVVRQLANVSHPAAVCGNTQQRFTC